MQNTSQLYQQIIGQEGHFFESKLVIDGVTYDKSVLVEMETSVAMFSGTPEIGNAVSGQISVKMLVPSAGIPTMARMEPYVRAKTATQTSEWIQQGVFFIDTREMTKNEDGENVLSIHGFDAMLKAEQMYNGRITGNSTDIQMVNEIAYQLGVTVDARTTAAMTRGYTIPFPSGYSYREILGYIAAMYVGCFIISDVGELRLVSILELPPETNYLIDQTGAAITFGGDRILV